MTIIQQQQDEELHQQWLIQERSDWVAGYTENDKPLYHKEKDVGRFAKAAGESKSFEQLGAGTYIARIYKILDLGTQKQQWEDDAPKYLPQVLYFFEVPSKTTQVDGVEKPVSITGWWTNSMNEKANLRRITEALIGRQITKEEEKEGFDQNSLLGMPCMISVVATKSGKTKIGAAAALPDIVKCPDQFNLTESFWLDEFNQEMFDSLSEGLQNVIKKSPEYQEIVHGKPAGSGNGFDDMEDDIPFN